MTMKETPASQEAFLDYYALGPERSLGKLAMEYQEKKGSGEAVPTASEKTLWEWSRKHDWQDRVMARVVEDGQAVRKQMQERLIGVSKRIAGFIEVELTRLLERLRDSDGEILAASVADVEKLAKLYYQVAGQPLADKVDHGGSIGLKHSREEITDEQRAELLRELAGISTDGASRGGGGGPEA